MKKPHKPIVIRPYDKKRTPATSSGWPEAFAAVALTGLVLALVTTVRTSDRIRDGEFTAPARPAVVVAVKPPRIVAPSERMKQAVKRKSGADADLVFWADDGAPVERWKPSKSDSRKDSFYEAGTNDCEVIPGCMEAVERAYAKRRR